MGRLRARRVISRKKPKNSYIGLSLLKTSMWNMFLVVVDHLRKKLVKQIAEVSKTDMGNHDSDRKFKNVYR